MAAITRHRRPRAALAALALACATGAGRGTAPATAPSAAAPATAPSPADPAAEPAATFGPRFSRRVEFTPVQDLEAAHGVNPHDHRGQPLCQRCHLQGEEQLHVDPVVLCAQCHDPARMKHPFDVQQVNPPADLPFDTEGRIVCHTCHDPHDVKAQAHGLRFAFVELCTKCHSGHAKKPAPAAPIPPQ